MMVGMSVAYCAPMNHFSKEGIETGILIGALISPGRNLGRCVNIAKEATNAGEAHSDDGRQA
jgi:hypothetical protein